jgi:hypothetical protein
MLYDPARHEPLHSESWDARRAQSTIERIVRDAETRFSAESLWSIHPKDADGGDSGPLYPLCTSALPASPGRCITCRRSARCG